jgi:hypothetical protein
MQDSKYHEVSENDIDPQPKRNQKPRPKKQTVGKPKLSKIFEVSEKQTPKQSKKKPCKCKKRR